MATWPADKPNAQYRLPGEGRQAKIVALIYVAWLLPAILGAILSWSWWVVLVLLIPGMAWYIATEGFRHYKRYTQSNPGSSLIHRAPMLAAVPLFLILSLQPGRFAGLVAAAGLVVIDVWHVRRQDKQHHQRPENAQARGETDG